MAGCQSVPQTADKAAVLNKIIAYDQALTASASAETESAAAKLSQQKTLTETEAVLLALNNNAAFKSLLIDLKLAKADLTTAGLLPNPDLLYAFGTINKPYKYAIDLPLEALWLRPIKLRAMKNEADATANRLTQSGLNLIKEVRVAYAQRVLAQEKLQVSESSYQLRQKIYTLSNKRLEAGDMNGKDILIAKNDAIITKRDWDLAQYDVQLKTEILLNLLGVNSLDTAQKNRNIQLSPNVIPACQAVDIDHLLTQSLAQRPDIIASQFSIDANKEKLKLSNISWFKLTGTADATSGQNGHVLGPTIRTTIPALNQNQGEISRAEAELERAELNLEVLKQQALLETRTAHLQYQQSCHDWNVLQDELMPSILETMQLTQQAYAEGDISYLQTLEANRQLVDAQMRQIQLKAELIGKWAELMRNIGPKLSAS
ncbi:MULTISPECIES: TolC family protein [Methylotenera]|uniref:TolC family protein n=1 Tax=Methylotenera TaxID=359407 RepID=UPI00039E163F|nr:MULTISPECIES: TolC family protein [Methylotenera]